MQCRSVQQLPPELRRIILLEVINLERGLQMYYVRLLRTVSRTFRDDIHSLMRIGKYSIMRQIRECEFMEVKLRVVLDRQIHRYKPITLTCQRELELCEHMRQLEEDLEALWRMENGYTFKW